jgi:hypothetical protein
MTAFIIGYLQGTVRRLLGIASILFAFLLAAQIRGPFGDFLVSNWQQFVPEYSRMLGFGIVFMGVSIVITVLIQALYERTHVFPRFPRLDSLIGGVLGVVEAMVVIGAGIMILDSYFLGVGATLRPDELLFIRDFAHAVNVSEVERVYHHDLIPAFFTLLGGLVPSDIRAIFAV